MKLLKATVSGLFTIFLASTAFGQTYSKVKIQATNPEQCKKLMALPVAVDHGFWKKDWFETDLSNTEIEIVKTAGFPVEVVVADVSAWYEARNKEKSNPTSGNSTQAIGCNPGPNVAQPTNFNLGNMGGFFTYQEYLDHIDNMATLYPTLITAKQPITGFQTIQSRPIYWVKISDNVSQSESSEPQVLYTSVHHAREPLGLSQLIFYMYFLLENYSNNTDVKNVVDNFELFFVPVINPDGYIYNQTTNPNGGGMWRKNRRNNGNNAYGVDLNRNYAYEWGGVGASTDPTNETYRGTGAFSEPETQAMKWFIENHTFVTALNYHTYSDLLLYPWGYTDTEQCVDHDEFGAISEDMVRHNVLANIQSSFLYPAAGDSDDWAYGDTTNKPKVWAMTPEVGNDDDGFWPTEDRIIPRSKEMVDMNMKLALIAGNYGVVSDNAPIIIPTTTGYLKYSVQRLGIQTGNFTITFTPLDNMQSMGSFQVYSGLTLGQTVADSVAFTLDANILSGQSFKYIIEVNNGLFARRDTITKLYGNNNVVFANTGAPLSDWTINNGWGLSTSTFFSAPNSLADSPTGAYNNNSNRTMRTTQKVNLDSADFAYLRFKARWDIEAGYDYAQVCASTDGQTWIPLCGKYTHPGSVNQDADQPIYDGTLEGWVDEEINLGDYTGQQIYLRFSLVSDQGVNGDGIYIDDITVDVVKIEEPNALAENPAKNIKLYPNPATDRLFITTPSQAAYTYMVYDVVGKAVLGGNNTGTAAINIAGLNKGMYFISIATNGVQTVKRFIKE